MTPDWPYFQRKCFYLFFLKILLAIAKNTSLAVDLEKVVDTTRSYRVNKIDKLLQK